MGKIVSWFKQLSRAGKTGVVLASIFGISLVGASGNPSQPATSSPVVRSAATTVSPTTLKGPVVTTQNVTNNVPIPFTSVTQQSAAYNQGTTQITTKGVEGVKTQTWAVTFTDGKETGRVMTSEAITTPPVAEVRTVGTKVALNCPNGTYVNSAGNTVCSPYSSNSAPSGATAQCRDGTYSFSQSRSGTCSHHGGVASWL